MRTASDSLRPQDFERATLLFAMRPIALDLRSEKEWQGPRGRHLILSRSGQKGFAVTTSGSAPSVTYSAVVSTINTNRSPLLSAVVPVVIYGLRLTLDLPWQSTTANNLIRSGECVINLLGVETIAAIEHLAQTATSIGFQFSQAMLGGRLMPAHMTRSYLRRQFQRHELLNAQFSSRLETRTAE